MQIQGTITEMKWTNPHGWLYIDVKDEKGKVVNWNFELASPNYLKRAGWSSTSLKEGDQILVKVLALEGNKIKLSRKAVLKEQREKLKAEGKASKAPLTESFLRCPNNKYVLLALLGATAGQGVVWYTGQFYALFYLQTVLKVHPTSANYIVAAALLAGLPLFVDKRAPIPIMRQVQITAGSLVLLGAILGTWVAPAFYGLSAFVGAGLMFAGISGWCGMAKLLAFMPWNRRAARPAMA